MPRFITLKLVNEQGTPHPWPGTDTPFEIGSELSATAVWIGVSADGSDNQIYPLSTPAATILGSWPHLYQGVQLNLLAVGDDSPLEPGPGEYVYYNSLMDFERLVAACCIADVVEESPGDSPGGPSSVQMMFGFSSTQFGGCAAEQVPYYVASSADPDNMTGVGVFEDAALTTPAAPGPGSFYVVVNGLLYEFNDGESLVGALIGPCDELPAMRFTVNPATPNYTVDFRMMFNSPQAYAVDWGDGSAVENFSGADLIPEHEYADAGTYEVRVFATPTEFADFNTLELINHPLSFFGFHPDVGAVLSMATMQIENCGLTDAQIDWASFNLGNIQTLILANNDLTMASVPQMPTSMLTLNLIGNNMGAVTLASFPNSVSQLYLNNAGVASFDGSGSTPEVFDLELSDNGLEAFDISQLDIFTLTILALDGNSLPQLDIDAILQALDTQGNTNGTLWLNNQTPNMPPSLAGAVAQGSLESKGWTVVVDS